MRYTSGKHNAARGSGKWPANWGVYSNRRFVIELVKTNHFGDPVSDLRAVNRDYTARMTIRTEGLDGAIVATFRYAGRSPSLRDLGLGHL